MKLNTIKPAVRMATISKVGSLTVVDDRMRGRAGLARRDRVLKRYPICAIHEANSQVEISTIADHRHAIADGGEDTEEQMWGLCTECHDRKSAEEASRRARGEDVSKPLPWLPALKPMVEAGLGFA